MNRPPIQALATNADSASLRPHHSARSAKSSNANGVPTQSPGLARSAHPGIAIPMSSSTPTGLRPPLGRDAGGTPLGFQLKGRLPRVGARSSRQPWALLRNAVGVGRTDGCASSANAEPSHSTRNTARVSDFTLPDFQALDSQPTRADGGGR